MNGSIVWDKELNVWHCVTCHKTWSSFDADRPDACDECAEEDVVEEGFGCPHCGERRVDYLQILEDAEHDVFCLSCQTGFNFAWNEPDIDMRREDYYLAGLHPQKPLI